MSVEWCYGCGSLTDNGFYCDEECRELAHRKLLGSSSLETRQTTGPVTLSINSAYQELAAQAGLVDSYNHVIRSR